MKKILLIFAVVALSVQCFSQSHKKIELAFLDYTESDSAFYNQDVPEDHVSRESFDLYYHFEGDSLWVKVKKGKALKLALLKNEASESQTRKYKRKKLFGKGIVVVGLAAGATVGWFASPFGGVAIIVASGGLGYYVISKSDKHLIEAIYLYNQSVN